MGWPVVLDPIKLVRGDTKSIQLHFWDDADKTIPSDLSGLGTVWASQARRGPGDVILGTLGVDGSDSVNGNVTVNVTVDFWTGVGNESRMKFDVQVSDSADAPTTVTTIVSGTIVVVEDITRD